MLVLRIVGVLAIIGIGTCAIAYIFSGERRYLTYAWRITKYALVIALIVLSLFFLERVLVL
jgi:hypothetical protein